MRPRKDWMRTRLCHLAVLALAGLSSTGCPRPFDRDTEERARELAATADEHLAASKLRLANQTYVQALDFDAANAHAAFGAAVTDLLLLADSEPVRRLLDLCGQPHFDFELKVFGPDGLLAKEEQARAGSGQIEVLERAHDSAAFSGTGFEAHHFRTYLRDDQLWATVSDARLGDTNGSGTLMLSLNVADLYANDMVATPLEDGAVIDLTALPYPLFGYVGEASILDVLSGAVVVRGVLSPGQSVSIELRDVRLQRCRWDGFSSHCDGELHVNGTFYDTISTQATIAAATLPFGLARDVFTPVEKTALIDALDMCGNNLSTDVLAAGAKDLAAVLDLTTQRLHAAAAGGTQRASFVVPKTLLHADADLILNGTDLLLLRTLTQALSGALRLLASYRYLDGPVSNVIGQYTVWREGVVGLEGRQVRDFIHHLAFENLGRTFLTRAAGFELGPVKQRFEGALADGAAALRNIPETPGLFDFQTPRARSFAGQLADQLDVLRASLVSASPVALARNPLYRVHLRRLFDHPIDRASLLMVSGADTLFRYQAPDPSATTAEGRNGWVSVVGPQSLQEGEAWANQAYDVPDHLENGCANGAACPAGYTCDVYSSCQPPKLELVDPGLSQMLFDERTGWPAFLGQHVHLLFDSWR